MLVVCVLNFIFFKKKSDPLGSLLVLIVKIEFITQ